MEDNEVSGAPNKLEEAIQKSKKYLSSQGDKKSETYLDMYVKSIAKSDDGVHVTGGGSRKSQDRHMLKGNTGGLNLRKSVITEEKSDEETNQSHTSSLTNGRTWKHTEVFHPSKLNRRPLRPEVNNDSNSVISSSTSPNKQEGSRLMEELGEKFAVCPNCGSLSKDFLYCDSCQKLLPKGVKTYTKTTSRSNAKYVVSKKSFYGNSGISAVFTKTEIKVSESINLSKRHENPPVCLTISSDEDDEQVKSDQVNNEDFQLRKERMLDAMGSVVSPSSHGRKIKDGDDSSDITDAFSVKPSQLVCRSVRIGSFKFIPPSKVQVSTKGICFNAPSVCDKKEEVALEIESKDIVRVMCHFGRSLPLLFIYTTPGCGSGIRSRLRMSSKGGPYYDPGSDDETQKRITLLPDRISDEQRVTLRNIFTEIGRVQGLENKSIMDKSIMYEIDSKTANEILVRSTPAEVKKMVRLLVTSPPFSTKIHTTASGEQEVIIRPVRTPKVEPKTVVKMMVYPPFPQTGGITITSEDYECLQEGEFLNDVIIDFYLRYLVQYKLSEADRRRTHVFSSFFYRRLTQKPTRRNAHTEDARLSASEVRHNRVKTWTRHVDIFSKDFIIIPINENAHWFLAVICFPYLDGPTSMKKKEFEIEENASSESHEALQTMSEENEDPLMYSSPSVQDPENQEDSMDSFTPDETLFDSTVDEACQSQIQETILTPNPIMQPCILIFDSLPGPNRGKIVSTLREYLKIEWKVKKESDRSFDKERMKGASPKVPQQTNFSDCGIYLLQYVESFFENPIRDYSVPIKGLKDWFPEDIVNKKRTKLRDLIEKLMIEQHGRNLLEELNSTQIPFNNNSEQSSVPERKQKAEMDCDEPSINTETSDQDDNSTVSNSRRS